VILRGVERNFRTDVSVRPFRPIFKGQEVQDWDR